MKRRVPRDEHPWPTHNVKDLPAFIKRVKAAYLGWKRRGKRYDKHDELYIGQGSKRRGPNSLAS